ncbi:hypothetical protein CIPAW_03G102700 [Carya illinoinensis]|uniref:Uncharacterized protein n=1 Tax=Carya illinoinensis TaxID=32201 RepID=A0A8T1R0N2_CARIL|nr:hypothetical protein CIPAW_03G102700 [Carya illinoinensis]
MRLLLIRFLLRFCYYLQRSLSYRSFFGCILHLSSLCWKIS